MQKSLMYLKSSMSISAYAGCTINCKYCILSTYRENNHISKIMDEEKLCSDLFNSKYFVKNFTSISVNNVSDPFLNPILKKSTFKILNILEKEKIKNPILLITKAYLNQDEIEFINSKKLNIYILYTFSGLSKKYENRVLNMQYNTMKLLSNCNKKIICYWRPVIEGVNSSKEIIESVAEVTCKYFDTFVVSGIRINSYLLKVFKLENIPIKIIPDYEHKVITEDTFNLIQSIIKKYNKNANIFKKTSCAISYLNGIPDYNNNYSDSSEICIHCHNKNKCINKRKLTSIEIESLLNKINCISTFTVTNDEIEYDGVLTQEECSYISQNSGYKIHPKAKIKSNSEDLLSK